MYYSVFIFGIKSNVPLLGRAGALNFELLCNIQSFLFLDPEILSRVFNALVTEQNLRGLYVARFLVNVGYARSSKGMGAVKARVKLGHANPLLHQLPVADSRKPFARALAFLGAKEGITINSITFPYPVAQGYAGVVCEGESHSLACLALVDRHTLFYGLTMQYIGHVQSQNIHAAQTGIYRHGKKGNVADIAMLGKQGADHSHLLGGKRWLTANNLSFVPRDAFFSVSRHRAGGFMIWLSWS